MKVWQNLERYLFPATSLSSQQRLLQSQVYMPWTLRSTERYYSSQQRLLPSQVCMPGTLRTTERFLLVKRNAFHGGTEQLSRNAYTLWTQE